MDVAELGLRADARQVDAADRSLSRFEKTAGKTERATDRLNRENAVAAQRFQGVASSLKGILTGMIGLGTAIATVRSATRTVSEFGQSIAEVRAITRATDEQMVAITATARQLGATTEFTASQAASGFRFLGQAGFTAQESIAAIPDVLNLATAAALDLGVAADIASNVMSGFGIAADNAARAADVMAAIASRANTDVKQLGDAMAFVGPVAAAMGIDIGDAAAAVGVLSDAGIQGGSAGTGLRRVLSSLANPTTQAADVLRGLGVTLQEVNPATNNLSDVIDRLARTGMSAADALTIFGDRGGPAVLALVENNERVAQLATEMKNVEGEAKRMAETMRDTLAGDAKALGSALQELALVTAGTQESSMRGALQSTTGFVRELGIELQAFTSYSLDSGEAAVAASKDYFTARDAIVALLNAINITTIEFQDLGDWLGYIAARTKLLAERELAARTLQFGKVKQINDQIIALDRARAESREAAEARIVGAIQSQMSASEKLRKETAERNKEQKKLLSETEKQTKKLAPLYAEIDRGMQEILQSTEDASAASEDFEDALQKVMDKLYPHRAAARNLVAEYKLLERAARDNVEAQKALALWLEKNGLQEVTVQAERVTKELITLKNQADPMAEAWEEATERIDESFAKAWRGAFDSFGDFADGIKDALRNLLGELAHMAITKPILISLGLASGPASAAGTGIGGTGFSFSSLAQLPGLISGNVISGLTSLGSAVGLGPQTASFIGSTGQLGYDALSALGIQGAGGTTSFLAGAGLTAGAGFLGGQAGSALFGQGNRQANSSYGQMIGGIGGAFMGGPIGAALGAFLGSGLDVLFGSTKPSDKRQYAGVGLGDLGAEIGTGGFSGRKFSQENQSAAVALIKEMQNLSAQLGGSNASVNVSVGGRTGLRYAAGGGENYQEFEDVASLLEAAFKDILAGATNLAPAVKDLAVALEDGAENTIAYAQALQSLWEAAGRNGATAAATDYANAQRTLSDVYSASTANVRQLAATFDGSAESVYQLSQVLAENQGVAYQLAVQYRQVRDSVGELFGGLSESIRTSLMSQQELYDYQRNQVAALGESISTLTDPQEIMRASQQAEQLMSGMWSRLSEEQREEMGPGFLETVEDFQQAATSRINEQLKEMESSQERTGELVRQGIMEAAAELAVSAQGFQEGTTSFQQAVSQISVAASQFASGGREVTA